MLVKHYGEAPEGQRRYSPAICTGATKRVVTGNPDKKHVSTSYAERSNLTVRMGCRRFTRLTNGFSKKVENHAHAVALHMAFYNLCRVHKSLRITPAMAAGVTDHVWTVEELVAVVEASLPKPGPRGPYKKRAESESYGPPGLFECIPARAALAALVARASTNGLSSGGSGSTGFLRNRPTNQRHRAMVASRVG